MMIKFVVPIQKVSTQKICLAEAIPFVTKPKNPDLLTAQYEVKRKLQWNNWQKKAKASISTYYKEIEPRINAREITGQGIVKLAEQTSQ